MAIAKFFAAVLLVQMVHIAGLALGARLAGSHLKTVSFGFGPILRRWQMRGVEVVVRAVLLTGYVQPWRSTDKPPVPPGTRFFDELPSYRRAAAILTGALLVFALGSLIAGSFPWRSAVDGALDLFRGALAPTSTGASLLGDLVTAARTLSFPALLSVACAKMAGWNLLPIPSMNGGAALIELFSRRHVPGETRPPGDSSAEGGKPEESERAGGRFGAKLAAMSLIAMLAVFVSWAVALVTYLLR